MYLLNTKVVGKYVRSYVPKEYPKKLESEELLELIGRVRADPSDQWARRRLFEGHIRIAMQIVGRYVRKLRCRVLEEELVDEAGLALVQAIDMISEKLVDDNVTGYIIGRIHGNLSTFIRKEFRMNSDVVRNTLVKRNCCGNVIECMELRDLIVNAARSDMDRRVVELCLQGYTDGEVAEVVGLTRQGVCLIRNKLRRRIRAMLREYM